jgi:hypothetical protein
VLLVQALAGAAHQWPSAETKKGALERSWYHYKLSLSVLIRGPLKI